MTTLHKTSRIKAENYYFIAGIMNKNKLGFSEALNLILEDYFKKSSEQITIENILEELKSMREEELKSTRDGVSFIVSKLKP